MAYGTFNSPLCVSPPHHAVLFCAYIISSVNQSSGVGKIKKISQLSWLDDLCLVRQKYDILWCSQRALNLARRSWHFSYCLTFKNWNWSSGKVWGILAESWQNPGKILAESWQNPCRIFAETLQNPWSILTEFWENLGKVLEKVLWKSWQNSNRYIYV